MRKDKSSSLEDSSRPTKTIPSPHGLGYYRRPLRGENKTPQRRGNYDSRKAYLRPVSGVVFSLGGL